MSNIYNTQPPTKGKVVLVTSHGDVDVELWAKEAPKVLFLSLSLFCLYAVAALTHRRRSPSPHLRRPAAPGGSARLGFWAMGCGERVLSGERRCDGDVSGMPQLCPTVSGGLL